MPEPRGRVVFRKQVSDGNYGTEAAEVSIEMDLPDDLSTDMILAGWLIDARRLVHEELAKSPAWRVRDAVTPSELPDPGPEPADPEDLPY